MGNYTKKEKTHFIRIPPEEIFLVNYTEWYIFVS